MIFCQPAVFDLLQLKANVVMAVSTVSKARSHIVCVIPFSARRGEPRSLMEKPQGLYHKFWLLSCSFVTCFTSAELLQVIGNINKCKCIGDPIHHRVWQEWSSAGHHRPSRFSPGGHSNIWIGTEMILTPCHGHFSSILALIKRDVLDWRLKLCFPQTTNRD